MWGNFLPLEPVEIYNVDSNVMLIFFFVNFCLTSSSEGQIKLVNPEITAHSCLSVLPFLLVSASIHAAV